MSEIQVFKICREDFSRSLNASGVENRWNRRDEFVIYAATSRSLAALELLAQRSGIRPDRSYKCVVFED